MCLFRILGKFEQNRKWSNLEDDFTGYFVKREDTRIIIEGYLEEKIHVVNEKTRYIKGVYLEDSKSLVFIEMCNNTLLRPRIFVFRNINDLGYWDIWDPRDGVFKNGYNMGHAKVKVEEIMSKPHIKRKVANIYERNVNRSTRLNQALMNQTWGLVDLLGKPYYPKDRNKKVFKLLW